jgi:hypothetical protein
MLLPASRQRVSLAAMEDAERKRIIDWLNRSEEEKRRDKEAEYRAQEEKHKAAEEVARLAWLNSPNRTQAIAKSFPALDAKLQPLITETRQEVRHQLYQLPLSARQLASVAETSIEFFQLAIDLFGIGLDDENLQGELRFRAENLSELLRRSGYYNALLSTQPTQPYWEGVADRIPFMFREIRHLRLLDRCQFPSERFDICGYSVIRMSEEELHSLGPPISACKDFYPKEALNDPRLSQRWFLQSIVSHPTGYLDEDQSPGRVWNTQLVRDDRPLPQFVEREIAAGTKESALIASGGNTERIGFGAEWRVPFPDHMKPTLLLSLFHEAFFEIPLVLFAEPGWRIIHLASGPFHDDARYVVSDDEWPRFQAFIRELEPAVQKISEDRLAKQWTWVRIAALHYLRATFASGKELPGSEPYDILIEYPDSGVFGDEQDSYVFQATKTDALLGYVFCLDALLGNLEDQSSQGVRLRAAILAGETQQEVQSNKNLLKIAQRLRGDLVHGRVPGSDVDLPVVRRICQRVLAMILSLAVEYEDEDDLKVFLHELPHSDSSRKRIERAQNRLYKMGP